MNYRWVLKGSEQDRATANQLVRELGLSRLTAELLCLRGLKSPEEAHQFLHPKLENLGNPYLMAGMGEAVDRIIQAIAGQQRILIYGDYDVDGVTSIVILRKVLQMLGATVTYHVPERLRDGYGMKTDAIERAYADRVRLVISADCGIRAHEVVDRARALGVDVIVTDHHLPEAELPRATAVLNPKRPDCPYPYKELAGVGVVLKLAQALLEHTGRQEAIESFIKIAAIGTIADVAPLTGENRIITRVGLEGMRFPGSDGLRALMDAAGISPDKPVTTSDIAFRIAPRMNAVGRMGEANPAIELFWAPSWDEAERIASVLSEHNARRQQAESAMIKEMVEMLEGDSSLRAMKVLVLAREGWHRGVIGIAAAKIVERFHRPTIAVSVEDELSYGSGRSIRAFHLLNGLDACSDLFETYGGHSHAAGLVIRSERVDEFRRRINLYADRVLSQNDLVPEIEIDAMLAIPEISFDLLREIQLLEPFGVGNPKPVFFIRDARIVGEPRVLKDQHLKFRVMQHRRDVDAIWWNGAERAEDFRTGDRVALAFGLGENIYNELIQIQLVVKDLSRSPQWLRRCGETLEAD